MSGREQGLKVQDPGREAKEKEPPLESLQIKQNQNIHHFFRSTYE